jgi:diguanylate cyclase (GGDEF)-like protein
MLGSTVPSAIFEPTGPTTAAGLPHDQALVRAYEMLEEAQSGPEPADLAAALEIARAAGWHDVTFVLHYARLAHAVTVGQDAIASHRAMVEAAQACGDPALIATALADSAEWGYGWGKAPTDEAERDLARAVAILENGEGALVFRPGAYVQCGLAYRRRRLWELETEMYARAQADLAKPLPASLARIVELNTVVVLLNHGENNLALACDVLEIGRREDARAIAAARPRFPPQLWPRVPPVWLAELRAMGVLLAAIAGEPVEPQLPGLRAALSHSLWPGYEACLTLAEAIRALDAGDHRRAAALAGRAEPALTDDNVPHLLTLAMSLAARAQPASSAARRYGQALAELRWRSRLNELGAARARLHSERVLLDNERLARRAYVDELTGLANRHAYARHLGRLRAAAADEQIAVLLVDLDHFKGINDRFGHTVGDEVLRRIGTLLAHLSRPSDLAVRLGGDEFLMSLTGCSAELAAARAHEYVGAVRDYPWHEVATGLQVGVSVGSAAGAATDVDQITEDADTQLYRAKAAGRGTARSQTD